MRTKTKKIIIISSAIAMVIVATVAIILAVYFTRVDQPLYARAREILSMTFKQTELGKMKDVKREISADKPLNLVNYYGDVTLTDLWKGIPDKQKPYTVVLLILGNVLMPNGKESLDKLEAAADECEKLDIPYAVQNINGETHMETRLPIKFLEERFAKHKNFYGLNAAELYNGITWRGDAESDQTEYLIDCIKLCAKYGAYFFWTDTNINYNNGMIVDLIERSDALYDTLKGYGRYVCMLNKESYGEPSSNAIMQGLWLAGLIGNWGIASDWWHWQVDGYKSLFDQNNKAVNNEWEQIFSYPENMYVQSMMLGMSKGATCFKAEAPIYSTTNQGKPIAGFQYGISPLFDRIIDKDITIPSKDTVFAETNSVAIGGKNWRDVYYNLSMSNLYPSYGELTPLVPENLRLDERNVFLSKGIPLVTDMLPTVDPRSSAKKDCAYLTASGKDWYFINPAENEKHTSKANFTPRINSAKSVSISAEEHTSAIISEQSDKMKFYISNYRTDKSNMINSLNNSNIEGKKWSDIIAEYLLLDENGNPKGVSDSAKRQVEIIIDGELGGAKPTVTFTDMGINARDYLIEEDWDAESGKLRLVLQMNGVVEFTVDTDDSGKSLIYEPRTAIEDTLKPNDISVDALVLITQQKIWDKEHYTYYSYLLYNNIFSHALKLINERTGTEEEIFVTVDSLNLAIEKLTDISKLIHRIDSYLALDPKNFSTVSYGNATAAVDKALREMLSVKPYSVQRSNNLKYAPLYKKFNKGDFAAKADKLNSAEKYLTKKLKLLEYIEQ